MAVQGRLRPGHSTPTDGLLYAFNPIQASHELLDGILYATSAEYRLRPQGIWGPLDAPVPPPPATGYYFMMVLD